MAVGQFEGLELIAAVKGLSIKYCLGVRPRDDEPILLQNFVRYLARGACQPRCRVSRHSAKWLVQSIVLSKDYELRAIFCQKLLAVAIRRFLLRNQQIVRIANCILEAFICVRFPKMIAGCPGRAGPATQTDVIDGMPPAMQVLVPDQSRIGGRRGDQRDAPAAYGGVGRPPNRQSTRCARRASPWPFRSPRRHEVF